MHVPEVDISVNQCVSVDYIFLFEHSHESDKYVHVFSWMKNTINSLNYPYSSICSPGIVITVPTDGSKRNAKYKNIYSSNLRGIY